ncbi:unnamed protein product [Meganyctiphanes norvegica]|uniref:Uncharacterized protein n=1 Tax=Meganyctiphanes norvegica TaxID=48144 RepID=A0AAV2RLI3_MEGNR
MTAMKVLCLAFVSVVVVAAENHEVRKDLLLARENDKPVKRMAIAGPKSNLPTPNIPLNGKYGPHNQDFNNNGRIVEHFANHYSNQISNPQQGFNNPQQFNVQQQVNHQQFNTPEQFSYPQYLNSLHQFNGPNQQLFNSYPLSHENHKFIHNQFNGHFGSYGKPCDKYLSHHFSHHFKHNSLDNHFNNNNNQPFKHHHYQFTSGNQFHGIQGNEFFNRNFNQEHRFNEFNDDIGVGNIQHPRSDISVILA